MILVGGENLIDFIQLDDGRAKPVFQANAGGSPYNCAKAIARQGCDTGYLTPISTDAMGDLLASELGDAGVEICAERRREPSSLAVVSLRDGNAQYQFYRDQTAERMVSAAALAKSTPENAQAFHLGSLAITAGDDADVWVEHFVGLHGRGVFTSFDPNIRPDFISERDAYLTRFQRMAMASDLLKLSDEDLSWLFPGVDQNDAARQLLGNSGAGLLVLTLGGEGATGFWRGGETRINAAPVRQMQDTVGAGDTFMATLLCELSASGRLIQKSTAGYGKDDVKALLQRASMAAALNCEHAGCNPPTYDELEARYADIYTAS